MIDSSTSLRCVSFLRYARDILGVNVIFSNAKLNDLSSFMTEIANNIRGSCDFILKMDTDEYLAVYDNKLGVATPYAVLNYLSGFSKNETHPLRKLSGNLRVGFSHMSMPDKEVCAKDILSPPEEFPPYYLSIGEKGFPPTFNYGDKRYVLKYKGVFDAR